VAHFDSKAAPATEPGKQGQKEFQRARGERRIRDAEGVEFEALKAPRMETLKASKEWGRLSAD